MSKHQVDTVDRYLKAKNCALWSNWDVTDDEERQWWTWLHTTLTDLMDFIDAEEALSDKTKLAAAMAPYEGNYAGTSGEQ